MSSFFDLIQKRESCRNFDGRPVEREKLVRCVEAARLAPSARNRQPWQLLIVCDPEKAKKMPAYLQDGTPQNFTNRCPAFIVLLADRGAADSLDMGLVSLQFCLAATEEGLATCMMRWFDSDEIRKLLMIPETKEIALVIGVGYTADLSPRPKDRKPLEEIAFFVE
ncbi:MAG TPA: nitroreductase family protein [Firmicutes bacterium]|nr:nitroreductase family protein [Bacillota bacterium]